MDPTAKNNSELLPGSEAEQSTLVLDARGRAARQDSRRRPEDDLGRAVATSTLGGDGVLRSKVVVETRDLRSGRALGCGDDERRQRQRQAIEQLVTAALPIEAHQARSLERARDLDPMTITIELEVPAPR
jgi:hypothetical protein